MARDKYRFVFHTTIIDGIPGKPFVPETPTAKPNKPLWPKLIEALVVLVCAPTGYSMPVIWRCVVWSISGALFLHLVATSVPGVSGTSRKAKWIASLFIILASWALAAPLAYSAWRVEKALTLEGDLISAPDPSVLPDSPVVIQIGIHGGSISFRNPKGSDSVIKFLYDAGLKASRGPKGFLLSTPIRDSDGKLIAEIVDNHWRVYPPYCSDKNFTKNALEVKDGAGHVAFHVAY